MQSPTKTCPKFSQLAFKPVPLTSAGCKAAALALKMPSAASSTTACYRAGEGEVCVVSTPKKAGAGPTAYGVICNGLATADEAAIAGAEATGPPVAPAGNGAEAGAAGAAAVVAGLLAAAAAMF